HLLELFEEAFEDASLDDGLAFLRRASNEVEGMNVPLLADTVDTAEPLLQPSRVPGQIVIDHHTAELKVDAFAGGLGRHANLFFGAELLLGTLTLVRVHSAVNLTGRIAPL